MANGWPLTSPARRPRLPDNEGHVTLLEHRVPEVHAWLLDHLRADRPRAGRIRPPARPLNQVADLTGFQAT